MLANLKTLRIKNKISQAELAKAVGTSQQSIAHYERGDVNPGLPMLIKLADYFHTSIDYLIGRMDDMQFQSGEYSPDEVDFLEIYRRMNGYQKEAIRNTMWLLQESDSFESRKKKVSKKILPTL